MPNNPSINAIGSAKKITIRTAKKTETTVSTQRPASTTPSPRGHA